MSETAKNTKRLTVCAMMAAVCVVLMLLGSVLGLGMYAVPLLIGILLIPIGKKYGRKYQIMLWLVISALSFMLIPNVEQNLMFAGLFGWYPILYPTLQKLSKGIRWIVKLLLFNTVVIAIEALVMLVLVPEVMGTGVLLGLLALGNVIFILYDRIIPKSDILLHRFSFLF